MICLLEYQLGLRQIGKVWNLCKEKEDQRKNYIRKEENEKSIYYITNCFEHYMDHVMASLIFM